MSDQSLPSIRFACQCGKKFEVGRDHIGKQTVCPECKKPITVPDKSTVSRTKKKKKPGEAAVTAKKNAPPAGRGPTPGKPTQPPPTAAAAEADNSFSQMMRQPVAAEKLGLYAGIGGFVGGLLCGILLMLPWTRQATPTSESAVAAAPSNAAPASNGASSPESPAKTPAQATPGAAIGVPSTPRKTPWKDANVARVRILLKQEHLAEVDPKVFPPRNFPLRFEANLEAKARAIGQALPAEELVMRFDLGVYPLEEQGEIEVIFFLFRDQQRFWPRDESPLDLQTWDTRFRTDDQSGNDQPAMFDVWLLGAPDQKGLIEGKSSGRVSLMGIGRYEFQGAPFTLEPFVMETAANATEPEDTPEIGPNNFEDFAPPPATPPGSEFPPDTEEPAPGTEEPAPPTEDAKDE